MLQKAYSIERWYTNCIKKKADFDGWHPSNTKTEIFTIGASFDGERY